MGYREQYGEHDLQWETLRTDIPERRAVGGTAHAELTAAERSMEVVEEIKSKFEVEVKKAHKEYDINAELDRINLSIEDGPGVSQRLSSNY